MIQDILNLDLEPAPPYEPNPDFISSNNNNANTQNIQNTSNTTSVSSLSSSPVITQRSRNNSDSHGSSTNNHNYNHNHHDSVDSIDRTRTSLEDSNILLGLMSMATNNLNNQRRKLKILGLKRLNPIQHLAVALCRDVSLIVIIKYLYILLREYYHLIQSSPSMSSTSPLSTFDYNSITSVRASEIFMAAVWCIVSGYLSYSVLDDLMLRWIVMYDTTAVLIRMLSMSLFIIFLIELLLFIISNENQLQEFFYSLPAWITISCVLTLVFIIQNFFTSNLRIDHLLIDDNMKNNNNNNNSIDDPSSLDVQTLDNDESSTHNNIQHNNINKIPRSVDLYNITVFAVVPIGIASFITMIVLIRLVIILRLDIDYTGLTKSMSPVIS